MEQYTKVKFNKGTIIFKAGEMSKEYFYIILSGKVLARNHFCENYTNTYKEGDIIGLISSITYKKYPEGFGGGDIKLLSSLGVLFGINNLYKVILISIISFVVLSYAFKQRYLPYASVLFLSFVIFVISNLLILK